MNKEKITVLLAYFGGLLSFVVSGMFLYNKNVVPCFIMITLGLYLHFEAMK